jgi:hypothetical protein
MKPSTQWLLGTALALTTACASSAAVRTPRPAPGGFDLRTPMPVALRSPFGEPYGVPVALGQRGTQGPARLDDYLKPVVLAKALPPGTKPLTPLARTAMPRPRARESTLVQAEQVARAQDSVKLAVSEPPSASSDAQRYASRELKSEKQQSFRGGDVLVIGAGTLLLILLVVLLVVLIIR